MAVLIERFGRRPGAFVLDSAQANDGLGAWSFFGADPFEQLGASGEGLDALRRRMQAYGMREFVPADDGQRPPFLGGAVGYLAYDYGRRLERIPEIARDDRQLPDMHFGLYDGIAAYHHATGRLYLVALGIRAPEAEVLQELKTIALQPGPDAGASAQPCECGPWEWNLSEAGFGAAVETVRSYIASGDVYQVNLSRRGRCTFQGEPLALYCALRTGNPAPYGAYLDCPDFTVLSTSPEQFLAKRGRDLVTRPIKGTRPRGTTPVEEARWEADLRGSEKDRAELLMIVDLERNDLGRVAEFGSVCVEGLYQLERYARVIHQTAQVKARLHADKDVYDAIEALFPGGSITGAPKIRAMEIIEELEPTRRGVYCGSVGYIGFDGDAEFNIAIRSLHLKNGWLDYQVGGGIVWDSRPESEFQETVDKGRAIHETIEQLCRKSS
ncbi:aminodeoxychorismate synthase component I [Coraliomargarita parva]|uniref:aminodeoxychorismate synthase component I n=1 Tax=Coraliomargarita parva TaxID=3014050 RepID=UPI0022B3F767|nr:aminodeoxychorismate synthase component I [Coraliomargarita parva]